jgi:hypothetical protein
MSFAGKTVEAVTAEPVDADVLFREARRRRRRRRLAWLAVAVLTAAAGWLIVGSSSGQASREGRAGGRSPSDPGAAGKAPPRATTLPPAMNGKYVPTAPAVLEGKHVLLAVGGFSFLGKEPFGSWFERSADGGRTWQPGSVTRRLTGPSSMDDLVFVDARRGWAGRWWTDDSGVTWRRWLPAKFQVFAIEPAGSGAWADIAQCDVIRTNQCGRDEIVTLARPGAAPRPLRMQPPLGAAPTLVHPDAVTGYQLTDQGRGHAGRTVIEATRDAGATWQVHRTPCGPTGPSAGANVDLATSGPSDLWLACQTTIAPDDFSSTIYRSHDAGIMWTSATRKPGPENLGSLQPADADVAWALSITRSGSTSVLRTSDGGRTFTPVLRLSATQPLSANGITVLSAGSAIVSGYQLTNNGGRLEVVYRTDTSGRTWLRSVLPAPTGIPTTRANSQ